MNNQVRNKGWKLSALGVLCAALTACGSGSAPAETGGETGASGEIAASGGKTAVTMTVMTKNRFLEEAEAKFESAHPDIDIQIEEVVPADDTATGGKTMIRMGPGQNIGPSAEEVDQYVNAVNTAIMSGKAADIVSAEHLPYEKYAEEGLIADWNELADQDGAFAKSDYFENIFDGVSIGGGWYGIPTSYTLDVMVGDASLLESSGLNDETWTWNQFIELLEKEGQTGSGKFGLSMVEPEDLLADLVETVYEQLVAQDNGDAVFDGKAFQAYMENVKKLYDDGLATAEQTGPGSTNFSLVTMQMPIEVASSFTKLSGEHDALLRPPGTGQDEGIPFKSNQVLALNANSNVKEAAWEFVKFLLSQEMQSSPGLMNFPVHREALSVKLKEMQEMLAGGGGKGGKGLVMKGPNGASVELTDEDIEQVLSVIPSVGKYLNKDAKVLNMIREESAAFFSGSKTAKAVADTLANRIATYLNE